MASRSGTGRYVFAQARGIHQAAGDTNGRLAYAYHAENMSTARGMLSTAKGTRRAFPALGAPIETLECFHRRSRPDDPDVLVAAAGGCIYTYTAGAQGWVKRGEGFLSNRWSCVTYETVENGATVDLLLMTNEKDGMATVMGSDLRVERKPLHLGNGEAEIRFAVLARHAERIFATGAEGYPDSVFYSRPYDPFDWTAAEETPELGGGVIDQPSWDGDAFLALIPFGGYLLAAKRHTVYEIRGTDPSNFVITTAYGTDGPVQTRSICADRTTVYYLTRGGLGSYDGTSTALTARDALHEIFDRLDESGQKTATACVCDHVYYLALAVKNDEADAVMENNAVIEYDTVRGTFMLRRGLRVKDFYVMGGDIYYTDADAPNEVLAYADARSSGYMGKPMRCLWETPWTELNRAEKKRDFELVFTAEADADDVPLDLRLETERGERRRTILLQRRRKNYRVRLAGSGVRVKLRLSAESAAGWRILGRIAMEYSMDEA